jgi:hypothetical protein
MGILATDILIKSMFEASLADLRKNNWILWDIFDGLANDSLSKQDYGNKETAQAVDWFLGNDIQVYLNNRVDTPRFPCITVVRLSSREMTERASLADAELEYEIDPGGITQEVQKRYDNFTPSAYNLAAGQVTLPANSTTHKMFVGQFLVSNISGKAYLIRKVIDLSNFLIAAGTNDDFTNCYIAPPTSLWNLQKELVFLDEQFAIGLHTESNLSQALWMRQLAQYCVLRYKEAYLERRGFELSTFNVGDITQNPHFNGTEMVWSCMMSLSGQVQADFIKYAAPRLEGVRSGIFIVDGPKTPPQYLNEVENQGWAMESDEKKKGRRRRRKGDLE